MLCQVNTGANVLLCMLGVNVNGILCATAPCRVIKYVVDMLHARCVILAVFYPLMCYMHVIGVF
jgi:hypothetical protein